MVAPPTPVLSTARLLLAPLRVGDAAEMVHVLADSTLYEFTGGQPPSLDELTARYRAQVAGPAGGDEAWHNWIIRLAGSGTAVGFVQATVRPGDAEVAWLVGVGWQGQGIATEAAAAMCEWLAARGAGTVTAHVHPGHAASARVAAAVGLRPSGLVDREGEAIWTSAGQQLGAAPPAP